MPSYRVTLTAADTNYSALALVRAIDSTYIDQAVQVSLQSDNGNSSVNFVLGGQDPAISATRYGFKLTPGDSFAAPRAASLKGYYLRGTTSGQLVNIEVTR